MSTTLITRSTLTDDDGSGTTGSIWNNAELQKIFDNVDAEFAAAIEFGSTLTAPAQPAASAFNNAAQSIANSTLTALTFNSEDFDVGALHSTSVNTSRMTATVAGLYLAIAKAEFAASAGGSTRILRFRKNGADFGAEVLLSPSASIQMLHNTALVNLAATDYIEIYAFQDSGGALNIGNASREQSSELLLVKLW